MIKITAMSKICTCKTTEKSLRNRMVSSPNVAFRIHCQQNDHGFDLNYASMVFYKNGLQETGPCPHFTLLNLVAREPLVYTNSDFCQVFIESVISVPLAL